MRVEEKETRDEVMPCRRIKRVGLKESDKLRLIGELGKCRMLDDWKCR